MQVRPLHDRILVKRGSEEEKTKAGSSSPTTPKKSPHKAKSLPWAMAVATKPESSSASK
jgi:co-chaperonin GroES (HSP10)